MRNIYDYIDEMKKRPDIFTQGLSLGPIETLLVGYCACLQANEIQEKHVGRKFDRHDFTAWLYAEKGWSGAFGFAQRIEENTSGAEEAFEAFFSLVQQFRRGGSQD